MTESLDELLKQISAIPEHEKPLMVQWLTSLLSEKDRLGDSFSKIRPEKELKILADRVLALKSRQELRDIAEECIRSYAGEGLNGTSWFTKDDSGYVMSVASVFFVREKHEASSAIIARISNEHIIIDEDITDKQLVDMLLQYGIPREQIILAYAGEKIEETA